MAIPNKIHDVKTDSNIEASVTGQFTLDENGLAKIMGFLTNLYSDPEMAVVREYLTNALDSQIEARENDPSYVWRPVEVTTPSHFNKTYAVRDFGIGMSGDDIRDIYSKYGKSTKESSNAVTGMLGLGSKCALTYTGQFTITGYKNGVRTRALVSKDENEIPVFMIVDTRATDEPNGVEISVPVRDRNSFAEKTREFLRWWKPGEVIVDGKAIEGHGLKAVKTDVYLLEPKMNPWGGYESRPKSYVIMGNVPYLVKDELIDDNLTNVGMGFAAYVPMGSVDFPPSREELMDTARTKATVKKISSGLFELMVDTKVKEIEAAPDFRTAWNIRENMPHYFKNQPKIRDLTFKGEQFPSQIVHEHKHLDWDWQGHGNVYERQRIDLRSIMEPGALIVTGVEGKPTSYFKKKVRQYMTDNKISGTEALLMKDDVDSKWLKWVPRIDADTIKALKLPKTGNTSAPRTEAEYDYYWLTKDGVKSDSQTTITYGSNQLVYMSPKPIRETYRRNGMSEQDIVRALGEGYTLVVMGTNRFEKFQRTYPKAITFESAFTKKIKDVVANADPAEFLISELEYEEREFCERVDPKRLDDKELASVVEAFRKYKGTNGGSKTVIKSLEETVHNVNRLTEFYFEVPTIDPKKKMKNPFKRYPLVAAADYHSNAGHVLIYVNAVYAHNNRKP